MLDRPGFEFSFSGLKTAVMQAVRAAPLTDQGRADVAWAVQDAIVDTLCAKALRALKSPAIGRWWWPAGSVRIAHCVRA